MMEGLERMAVIGLDGTTETTTPQKQRLMENNFLFETAFRRAAGVDTIRRRRRRRQRPVVPGR